ncbi:MAG: ScyD/ScyE family protein [Gemmatimonadota bacterium]
MRNRLTHSLGRPLGWAGALTLSLLAVAGCSDDPAAPDVANDEVITADARGGPGADQIYEFDPPVFDIAAAPNGNILVAETVFPEVPEGVGGTMSTVKEIRRTGPGGVRDVVDMTHRPGAPVNGLASLGAHSFFAAVGGKDLARAAGVWHVTPGGQRLIGDVEAFETEVDPDANGGPQWKLPACEVNPDAGFSAGPQSNPYHLAHLQGGTALVADGAGNSLLEAKLNGQLDWVAVFTPPTPTGDSSDDPADWMVLFPLGPEGPNCYVQPVPTSVAIGPDGGYYVGELTGVTPMDIGAGASPNTGLSRVWRVEPGARNVTCPSADCEQVLGGFTSILDVAFGPDGLLYVVEYDEANWFAATALGTPAGGTVNACDVGTGACSVVEGGLVLPSAITFDKWGDLWLLENNLGAPTVRQVDLD